MPSRPTGKPQGRPRIQINWEEFDKLARMQCTLLEIADFFECSHDVIQQACKREKGMIFKAYYDQKRAGGHRSLRGKQYDLAMDGNVSMLIWLGKQYLDQKEKQDVTSADKPFNAPVIYIPDNGRGGRIGEAEGNG
jgi:hypothetical protein